MGIYFLKKKKFDVFHVLKNHLSLLKCRSLSSGLGSGQGVFILASTPADTLADATRTKHKVAAVAAVIISF